MALREVRERFFIKNVLAKKLDEAFKTLSNPTPTFFMSDVSNHSDLKNLKFTLVRLDPDVERRFGIHGEVAVFYAPWRDFQRRSYNAIMRDLIQISNQCQEAALGKIRFTPTTKVAIVVSNDTEAGNKITEWSEAEASSTAIGVIAATDVSSLETSELRSALLQEIRNRLGDRDLYQAQNPVTGDDFFGRDKLLRDLSSSVISDQNVAIFGLRRSGKTSVIRELKRSLRSRSVIITISDMQLVTLHTLDDVARSTLTALLEDLREAKSNGARITIGSDADALVAGASIPTMSDRIRKIAARNPGIRIVLAVDEIEHLIDMAKSDPHQVRAFLGAMRSCAQMTPNVSLMFSGVANQMFLSSSLGEGETRVDNPMFGQVESTFMTPFSSIETADLVRGLGRPMFLRWGDDAVDTVHRATGGWPFFVRHLCSAVLGTIRPPTGTSFGHDVDVTLDAVESALPSWRKGAARTWTETIQALEFHYPDAAYLLSPDVDEDSLTEWISNDQEAERAAQCLDDLGLLVHSATGYRFSESLTALRALSEGAPLKRLARDEEFDILTLAAKSEGQRLEFKSSARVDLKDRSKQKYIEEAILKTVAGFMNSDGGDLLIGVADDGSLVGIGPDLEIFDGSVDRFERWLLGDLLGRSLGDAAAMRAIAVTFPKARGVTLAHVTVTAATGVVLVNDSKLYVRMGNQTKALEGREFLDHVKARG